MRTNIWLAQRLDKLWDRYFADVQRITPVKATFGRQTYRRLGSIALRRTIIQGEHQEYSRILISAVLADPKIPDLVINQVLAHEMVHYIHGFGSRHPRRLRHPHQGGVILQEFHRRGLWELYRAYQAWMKIHWTEVLAQK